MRADPRIRSRETEIEQHRRNVQTGAADQDRPRSARLDGVDRRKRVGLVARDVRIVGDVERVDEVMGNAIAVGFQHFGRADVHAPVELHRIGVHHLGGDSRGGEPLGDVQR